MNTHGRFDVDQPDYDSELWADVDSLSILLRVTDDGLIVDVWPRTVADHPIATLEVRYDDHPEIFFPEEA